MFWSWFTKRYCISLIERKTATDIHSRHLLLTKVGFAVFSYAWGGPGSGGKPDVFTPIFIISSAEGLFMRLSEESDPTGIIKADLKATNGIIHQLGFK